MHIISIFEKCNLSYLMYVDVKCLVSNSICHQHWPLQIFVSGILIVICITENIFLWGGLPFAHGQVVRPPNFSPDAIPETSFTCEDKITGGYYADLEADCQLFHVCVQVSEYEVRKILTEIINTWIRDFKIT